MMDEAQGDKKWLVLFLLKIKGILKEVIKWLMGYRNKK
jgi:hypothetical protein